MTIPWAQRRTRPHGQHDQVRENHGEKVMLLGSDVKRYEREEGPLHCQMLRSAPLL